MNLKESNEIFRRAIIKVYFEPRLLKMDYHKSPIKHPLIQEDGLAVEDVYIYILTSPQEMITLMVTNGLLLNI